MPRLLKSILLALVAQTLNVCEAQTAIPNPPPELKYPPIARIAHVEGDVVVSFRKSPEGETADVKAISGPGLL